MTNTGNRAVGEPTDGADQNDVDPIDGEQSNQTTQATAAPDKPRGRGRQKNPDTPTTTFWERLSAIDLDEWPRHLIYVYRLQPITDRIAAGNQTKFIAKYSQRIDENQLMVDYGSGSYRCLLNYTDPATGRSKTIDRVEFDIENPAYPPNIPDREWMDDPRNKKWAWAKNGPQAGATATPAPTAAPDGVALFKAVMDGVKELRPREQPATQQVDVTKAVIDAMKTSHAETMAMADPTKTLGLVTTILDRLAPKQGGTDTQTEILRDELKSLRDELKEERAHSRDLLERIMDSKTAAPVQKTRLEILREIKEEKEILGELDEGGGRPGKFSWGQFASDALGQIAQAVAPALPYLFTRTPPPQGPQPMRPAAPPNGQSQPAALPAGADPAATQAQTEEGEMLMVLLQQYGPMLKEIEPFLLDHLKSQLTGLDFGDWFKERYGANAIDAVKKVGRDRLIQALGLMPGLREKLQPYESVLVEFIDDFVNWAPAADDDPPQTAAPATVEPGPVKKAAKKSEPKKKGVQ